MKKKFVFPGLLIGALTVFFACKKEYTRVATGNTSDAGIAGLKIVHLSPKFTTINGKPDGLDIFFGTTKVNGPVLKFGTAYPAIGSPNAYAAVPSGDQNIKITVGGTVTSDSLPVNTIKETVQEDELYTLLITDNLTGSSTGKNIWLHDVLPDPAAGTISIRFVNMVLNAPATDSPYLFSKRRNLKLFSLVQKDSVTTFAGFPTIPSLDTFYVRLANVKDIKKNDSTVAQLLMTSNMPDQSAFTLYFAGIADNPAAKRSLIYTQHR